MYYDVCLFNLIHRLYRCCCRLAQFFYFCLNISMNFLWFFLFLVPEVFEWFFFFMHPEIKPKRTKSESNIFIAFTFGNVLEVIFSITKVAKCQLNLQKWPNTRWFDNLAWQWRSSPNYVRKCERLKRKYYKVPYTLLVCLFLPYPWQMH